VFFNHSVLAATLAGLTVASTGALAGEDPYKAMPYVPGVTNPTFNESPFITTEIRPIYIHHDIPDSFAGNGKTADVIAVQARYAITDRLALIATKDGFAKVDFGALPDDDGFLNIAAGLKYAVIHDPEAGSILTIGARYEIPIGDVDAGPFNIQGAGDGFANVFVTGAQQFGKIQFQGSANAHIAIDSNADASILVGALHVNYAFTDKFFPLVEVNAFHYFNNPGRTPLTVEGFDVFSLGGTSADDVVSLAGGFRWKVLDNVMLGAAAEFPVTDRDGELTQWRLTADAVITF